jgi:predicted metal-dependent hydrolase
MAKTALKNAPLLTPDELSSRLGEFYESLRQFNDGYWFESHETLEDLWQVTPLPERTLFQGVIQAAAAFVHFARGEYPGIFKLCDSALEKLRDFVPEALGMDVASFVVDLERCRAELEALGPEAFASWDESHAPMIPFREAA